MDDKFVRQYDYKVNSNLVLPSDTSLIDKRPSNEATGEVQSLAGRLQGKMGDRVTNKKREDDEQPHAKPKTHKKSEAKINLGVGDTNAYSVADIDSKDLLYQPKSDLTAAVYALIVKSVRKHLGFQHNSIINGAADEIIRTMKDPNLVDDERRLQIDQLLSVDRNIDDDEYNELCNLCKRINDYEVADDAAAEEGDEVGVAFSDDEDSMSDEYMSEVQNSDDDNDIDEMFDSYKRPSDITPKIDFGEPIRKEGYQEWHIEPKKRAQLRQDNLKSIDELPAAARQAFIDLKKLNVIQSSIYETAMGSDKSLLICAPTGAGKTNIAILCILREILKYQRESRSGEVKFDTSQFKIIYVAPIKALVQEVVENFTRRLGCPPYDLKVDELTGDNQLNQKQISRAQIIVCTPEKWDIVTRKSLDRLYTKLVRLVIFDEIHLLHNERGATLEALVSRIKRHKSIEGKHIRIVGLSATLPNYADVARFIAPNEPERDSTFYFDSTYRPIPLKQQYIAMTETKKAFRMINDLVYEKVIERLIDPYIQILVFVHSRPDTVKTAEFIKGRAMDDQKLGLFLSSESAVEKINELSANLNPKLKELIQFGFGVHHAGMSKNERASVEELFRTKSIRVLVSTATLAWGVNLPARTVIIKGTQVYRDGRWTDLDSLDVTQMLGRAGRPGYDKEGEGIVITQQSKVQFYMSLMTEQLPVESRLIARLPDFINAEVVVGNIESLNDAVVWLSETYLNSRMLSVLDNNNKQYLSLYGIDANAKLSDPKLASHKHNLVYSAACSLDDRGLVVLNRATGDIKSTELGRIASHYNCSSRTIKLFHDSIHEHTSDIELLRTFSMAEEFKDIFVRRGEETDMQTLLNQVPYPIDEKRATPGANKVNALLQVYIFRLNIEGSDLICDMHFIKENAARLARAIYEIALMKKFALIAELSLDLCRKIDKRMTICHTPLRQFADDLDADIISRLEKKNYHIDELRMLKGDKISELLRCDRRYGERVYKMLKYLPRLKVEASVKPASKTSLQVVMDIVPEYSWNEKYHGFSERFWLMVEDVNQEALLHYEVVHIRKYDESVRTTFFVPYLTPAHQFYYLRIFPDNWFGCDHHIPVHIEKLTLPDEFNVVTQPLDLELLPVSALDNTNFERIYNDRFKGATFNQIQTQVFQTIYQSDEDVVLLASAGCGKTTCAELAMMRIMNMHGNSSKIAFVAANAKAAKIIHSTWAKTFGRMYGLYLLTGNHRIDAGRCAGEDVNIIVGDPYTWHVLSLIRSKKFRKLFNKIQLFVIDDIHLLYDNADSVLEWLCTKIRIIIKLMPDAPARLVVLGSPMACAESIKNWLALERGSKEPVVFNYPTSIRPVKLQLSVQRYHLYDYKMRLLAMQRPVYRNIMQIARERPVFIFVADHLQMLDLAETLVDYAKSEGRQFIKPRSMVEGLKEANLNDFVNQGIGCLYNGMHQSDCNLIEKLYEFQQVQILIATYDVCWSIRGRSYLTIIMDTQLHNGDQPRDVLLTDIMQMVGLTGRPLEDHECRCIIMCQHAKADYYERFLHDPLPAESDMPISLANHVNLEIATGALTHLNDIYKPYLAQSFFYRRITINPNFYGLVVPEDPEQKAKIFGTYFNDLVSKVALDLEKSEFIILEEGNAENPSFEAGPLAKIALEYYINFETLANFSKWLPSNKSLDLKTAELMELLSTNTVEFKRLDVKHGERATLRSLEDRYRVNERDQLHVYSLKVKLLMLTLYQNDEVDGELIDDRNFVSVMSYKLLMAIVDIAWLRDSFSLAKSALQLAKRLNPFSFEPQTYPHLDMDINVSKEDDAVEITITVIRENEPFSFAQFEQTHQLPESVFREEGWCFLMHGVPKSKKAEAEKFTMFKRVKTPKKGHNEYKLEFALPEDSAAYTYELYFMSDIYTSKEDRKIPDINL